ncbi:sensor histidine kinase [Kitasatospora sp. NPDC096147]|uniref:sensor histidine kinase n=1 Tax=Kitasatospora sp. NPDC096147 TaxID=3364093 RepID=UPI0037F7035D
MNRRGGRGGRGARGAQGAQGAQGGGSRWGWLIGRTAARRWVHLVLGGALLMPFWLVGLVLVGTVRNDGNPQGDVLAQFQAFALALLLSSVAALLPTVRVLEATAARALGLAGEQELAGTPSRSWGARRRTALWFVQHLFCGGVVSGMSLSIPPAVWVLLFDPGFEGVERLFGWLPLPPWSIGLLLSALLTLVSAGAGAWLARTAPLLLGPTPGERLAAAEQRALELAQRNMLARELHDSVGHALSAVGIQAAAAGRVLRSDPEFAAEALKAIEETARAAVAELDTVLGLLRDDPEPASSTTTPTLTGLRPLLRQVELAGVAVAARVGPGTGELPAEVSRAAYRIIQEGLTNVLRHAGRVSAELRIDIASGALELELTNPVGDGRPSRPGGGRGLHGMAERAAVLRGSCTAGPDGDGGWRLTASLPLSS